MRGNYWATARGFQNIKGESGCGVDFGMKKGFRPSPPGEVYIIDTNSGRITGIWGEHRPYISLTDGEVSDFM